MTERSTTLRSQQKDLTRRLIMEALADLVSDEGVHDFSIQEVADRAGVSERTVYRYFPSRQALLEGLTEWLDETIVERGGLEAPESLEELPSATARNFAIFEELGPLVRALVVLAVGARVKVPRRSARTERFLETTAAALPHLEEPDVETAGLVLRLLASSNTWFQLREEHGLDIDRAGRAVSWALGCLIRDLESGDGPGD